MKTQILKEAGYEQALQGMALSYYDHITPFDQWWTPEKYERAQKRAKSLAFKGMGHSKFLESIQLWIFVQAPRAWWSEFDTYRVGITKQSASTMHTLSKRMTVLSDYEKGTSPYAIIDFNRILSEEPDITTLKMNLPEGWLQERIISTNYKTLQNIVAQRENHRLVQWKEFCSSLKDQIEHPEFIWQD